MPGYNSFSLAAQDNLHPVYTDAGADPTDALQAVDQAAEEALIEEIDIEDR
ncbi:hypothetical protein [Egibacter rhizosphaerae]|uniref:hypothetical protein n=1 Tax=Egibacter rhizosphaerae TaxID=1670831 RepID=UPI001F10F151|nr:hypothetical protein [Egibacter rhizosphaerae]